MSRIVKSPMKKSPFNTCKFILITALLSCLAFQAQAQPRGGWFGGGEEAPLPSLRIQHSEISLDGPTPMDGQSLQLLLSLPNGLGQLKQAAVERFSTHLQTELQSRFTEMLTDEDIPVVQQDSDLVLDSTVDVAIRQQIRDVMKSKRHDTEKGSLKVYGTFRYTLRDRQGALLDEQLLDLESLEVERRYVTRTPRDGGAVEDSTGPAVERALTDLVEEIVDQIEDRFESDTLQELAMKDQAP
ncbi:hypothetical protein [Microbulbifer sediminum]|uniref:hypothetical protein n=1 Tax=Microbulbifer sediminum TaxID=2904250 RepID=UPI001F23AE27|nr:hypothetical protein [Microbulbifer sediminum]